MLATECVTFATYPEIQGVEFLSRDHSTEKFDAHMHECFTIGVTLEGTERFWCRGVEHLAAAGEIAMLNPHEVHKGGPGADGWWTYRMIYPSAEILEAAGAERVKPARRPLRFPTVVVRDPEFAVSIASLQDAMEQADSPLERQSLLLGVLGTLVERHSSATAAPPKIGRETAAVLKIRDFMKANYATSIRLDDLSEVSGLSSFHLLRTFRSAMGMPPHAYLRQVRVEQAKNMLAGGMPISEVALATGFVDQSHLTRFFKRILGMTPGAYANGIHANTVKRASARTLTAKS